jgi:CubicO group peptidase (beta-lactamase class C family)
MIYFRWMLLTALVATSLASRAEDFDATRLAGVRRQMQSFVDAAEISGAVTVIGRKEEIVSLESVGLRDLEQGTAMPKDALFRIASMTKPITAIGIMILADEDRLTLDDPVEKHLPEFRGQMLIAERGTETITLKKPSRPITIKDLLTHTSGLPGRMPEGLAELYTRRDHTLAEAVMALSQRPLDFEPGTQWAYSSAGIDTLGRIIEVVSGRPYEKFLFERIFQPLGMKDTTFYPSEEQLTRLATMYRKEKATGKLVAAPGGTSGPPKGARYPIPAGGLFSTGPDLARLYQMMLNDGALNGQRILSARSVKAMSISYTGELAAGFSPGMGWGLGWGVVRKPEGVTEMLAPGAYGHGGGTGPQGWIDPEKNLFLIMLIQRPDLSRVDESRIRRAFPAAAVEAMKK